MKLIERRQANHHTGRENFIRNLALIGILSVGIGFNIQTTAHAAQKTTFTIGAGTEPDTLDTQGQGSTAVMNYLEFAVETLVRLESDASLSPGLAKSWEVSEDTKQVTFHLQEGVKFHDGTPFNAEAVKFNFDRLMDKEVRVPLRGRYSMIENVEVIDEHTLRINLNVISPAFVGSLARAPAGITSPASIDKNGNTYTKIINPVGTGPFKFVDYVSGDHLTFEKWDSYWGKAPYYDVMKILIMPEPAAREAAVLSGQADMIMQPPSVDIAKLKADPKLNVIIGPTTRVIYFAMNYQSEAFSDVRVRHAMNYAVDKQLIIKSVLFDAATPTNSPLSSLMASHCEAGAYEYNPEKARQLLSDAGAKNLKVSLIAPNGHYIQDRQAAQAVAAYLREIGVTVSVRTTDWATYLSWIGEPAEKQGAQINMFGYAGPTPDAATPSFSDYSTTRGIPPNGYNTAFYSNKEFESLWEKAMGEPDKQKRDDLYCQAQKIMWEDAPWIFLWNQGIPIVTQAGIEGVETLPNEMYRAIHARPTNPK